MKDDFLNVLATVVGIISGVATITDIFLRWIDKDKK